MPRTPVERLARALMIAGVVVAVFGVGAWWLDAIPPMPEWMLRLAVYKLTIAAAVGLIAVGAFLRRSSRDSAVRRGHTGEHTLPAEEPDLQGQATRPKSEARR
jgi:membrane protein implicated in regulation of membrane protease activity